MKLKLIDEEWIDAQIRYFESKISLENYTREYRTGALSTLNTIKQHLESPVEEIKKAFIAGMDYGLWREDMYYDEDKTPDVNGYLKRNNYE